MGTILVTGAWVGLLAVLLDGIAGIIEKFLKRGTDMVITAEILEATLEHLFLAYTALLVGALVSVPLIFLSLYNAKLASLVMRFSNLVQAVPSFAVVAVVVPLIGIGFFPAVIAIMLRVLLPIVKNTYIGLFNVDPALLDSAKGIGMTDFQVLRYVRLPNAYPAIFAGIKFAAILANSIAVLTALIGGGAWVHDFRRTYKL